MVNGDDINRLAWELNEIPSGKTWCEKRGIDFEGVSSLVSYYTHELVGAIDNEEYDYPGSLAVTIGNAFRLGWETRHQYGDPKAVEIDTWGESDE